MDRSKKSFVQSQNKGRPLVSYLLLTYNVEPFIQDAVSSALNQNYSPLEIIISDDASSDKTYEIAQSIVGSYDGPNRVILSRSPRNLGLLSHLNKALPLCKGDVIVMASGDDISLPWRTGSLVELWEYFDRVPDCLVSDYEPIGPNSEPVDFPRALLSRGLKPKERVIYSPNPLIYINEHHPHITGATLAITRRLVDFLGPFPQGNGYEDLILGLRSMLLGGVAFLNEALVKYRRHGRNLFFACLTEMVNDKNTLEIFRALYAQTMKSISDSYIIMESDIRSAFEKSALDKTMASRLLKSAKRQASIYRLRGDYQKSLLVKRWLIFIKLALLGTPFWVLKEFCKFLIPDSILLNWLQISTKGRG